ncbi:MAG: AAA family ATPase, partial [Candidatus Riflebacteria bacterium]|nr:AAA family ATPase [Candidatus Riflebacteria bacterium]
MIIKRDIYLNKLTSKKNNGLIKVITGLRRCGKSFLLFELFKNQLLEECISKDHIIEMSFDSFENEKYCNPKIFF